MPKGRGREMKGRRGGKLPILPSDQPSPLLIHASLQIGAKEGEDVNPSPPPPPPPPPPPGYSTTCFPSLALSACFASFFRILSG